MKLEHSNILIVDDDAETLALLHEILSKEGYDISTAPHPKAALEQIGERAPDLVMSDIHMPDMDGLNYIASLRYWLMSASLNPSALARLLGGVAPRRRARLPRAGRRRPPPGPGRPGGPGHRAAQRARPLRGTGRQPDHRDGRVRPPPRGGLPQQRAGLAGPDPDSAPVSHGTRFARRPGVEHWGRRRCPGPEAAELEFAAPGLAAPGLAAPDGLIDLAYASLPASGEVVHRAFAEPSPTAPLLRASATTPSACSPCARLWPLAIQLRACPPLPTRFW